MEAARLPCSVLWLVGGEPLAHPRLSSLLAATQRMGLSTAIATDGRMLAYPKVRDILLGAPSLSTLRVALQGPDQQRHERAVQTPEAWVQTVGGVQALLSSTPKTSARVELAYTVTADRLEEATDFMRAAANMATTGQLAVRLVAPTIADTWPMPTLAIEMLLGALNVAQDLNLNVSVEGFPRCWLPERMVGVLDDSLRLNARPLSDARHPFVHLETPEQRVRVTACQRCQALDECPGAPVSLVKRWGEDAVSPTRKPKANSFNFERVDDLPVFFPSLDDCPGLRLKHPAPPHRVVLLHRAFRVERYVTDTADFSDDEVRLIKARQRLYFDQHRDATLVGFNDTIRAVRRHPTCERCPHRDSCAQLWVQRPGAPFEQQESWLRQRVAKLRGAVLDIGCGEQPYAETIRRLILDSTIDYHGLDPDAGALERARRESPEGTYHLATVEAFDWRGPPFDEVLVLRSVNHFLNVRAALQVITTVTRPGSRVVLCDAPVFALLRSREQVRTADRTAPVGHEHYRNWTSYELLRYVRPYPFTVTFHRPVLPTTGGEWLLELTRTDSQEETPSPSS